MPNSPRTLQSLGLAVLLGLAISHASLSAQEVETIRSAGRPAQLDVRAAGEHAVRITLKPVTFAEEVPFSPALVDGDLSAPAIRLREIGAPVRKQVGALQVEVRRNPLTVMVRNPAGKLLQELVFQRNGHLSFTLDGQPVLGMGEGGPRPAAGANWREQPVEFDRRGRMHGMNPRWQSDAYGSRNPVAMLVGTGGWGLFVVAPWGEIDLRRDNRGVYIPRDSAAFAAVPQDQGNQHENLGKGIPPASSMVRGLYDLFVFDASDPAAFMKDVSVLTGPAALPPRWTMGYMQSHRTLDDEDAMMRIVDTFREKQIPLDAVIYLGTGFAPRGWNTEQPSFDFNPEVFRRSGKDFVADLHRRHVKIALHIVPWNRTRLPTLTGSIPAEPGETVGPGHLASYWPEHQGLMDAGVDAFWPDEGDWFNLFERMERHKLYYQGPLSSRPNVRPWSLHRNGHLGIARWGGWVWSGDTQSSWKTLEAQVAVGINHSLSVSPFWGSDIGGFYSSAETTGELYARWIQFGAFVPAFRTHRRTWWTGLPWGWGQSELGPIEDQEPPLLSELENPTIEPIAKKYIELRYQLLPYNYTLAWETRATGMPMMRALWLHYPEDERARGTGGEYLWGRDLLVAPVFEKGADSRELYLPEGDWYDWWTGARLPGGRTVTRPVDLATMPIYVRAGAIIPIDPVRQYTDQPVSEPTTLRIYPGADGEFTLYDDDGSSLDYLRGEATLTRMRWDDQARTLTLAPGSAGGAGGQAARRTFRVQLQPEGTVRTVTYAGQSLQVGFP
jgi:alpha-glucosidase/alpha-D-xyloside xylohydrolase